MPAEKALPDIELIPDKAGKKISLEEGLFQM